MRLFKRATALVLCVVLMLSMAVFAASAEELTEGNFTYTVNEDNTSVTITAYTGDEEAVVIPDTINGLAVTVIGKDAFLSTETMTSVTLPAGLKVIGSSAFATCTKLTSVSIPASVTSIGAMAFYNCFMLKDIELSPYTYDIGYQAFHNTLWMSSADDGLLYIGRVLYAYIGVMPANYKLVVKNGTAAIAPYAFDGRYTLSEVYLPVGLRLIGSCAFLDCTMMTFVRIPPSVTTADGSVFLGAPATAVYGVNGSVAETCALENDVYFVHDATLDYPDGDMNRDGIVNTADFRIVLMYLLGSDTPVDTERLQSCDIIYDGTITTGDVRDMMKKSLGLI